MLSWIEAARPRVLMGVGVALLTGVSSLSSFGQVAPEAAETPEATPDAPAVPEAAGESIEDRIAAALPLDLQAMASDTHTLEGQFSGEVWDVQPGQGRRLILIPVRVEPVESELQVRRPPIDVRAGRFVTWAMFEPDPAVRQRPGRRSHTGEEEAFRAGDSRSLDKLLDLDRKPQSDVNPGLPETEDDGPRALDGLPEGAPRIAREFTLLPDGQMKFDLERSIPGGIVKQGEGDYQMLLDRDRIDAKAPVRPEQNRGGENQTREQRLAASRQYAEQMAQYREASAIHRELRKRIFELPTEFTIQSPPTLYAIFEISDRFDVLEIQGPEPLPWSLGLRNLELVREFAGQRGGGMAVGDPAGTVVRLTTSKHLCDQRLATWAIRESNVLAQRSDDAPQSVIDAAVKIVQSGDPFCAGLLAVDAATVAPPTSASARILAAAAKSEVETLRERADALSLASLRARLSVDVAGQQNSPQTVTTAVEALKDPMGPPPARIFTALLSVLEGDSGVFNRGTVNEELVNALDLTELDADRLDDSIRTLVMKSPTSPLAASWLDHTVLRSPSVAVKRAGLEILADVSITPPPAEEPTGDPSLENPEEDKPEVKLVQKLDPLTGDPMFNPNTGEPLMEEVVIEPKEEDDTTVAEGDAGEGTSAPAATQGGGIVLDSRIPMLTADHGLLQLLATQVDWGRTLAWRSLDAFDLPSGTGVSVPEVIDRITTLGLQRTPVPAELVPFLEGLMADPAAQQQVSQAVTAALVAVVSAEDNKSSEQAIDVLLGSEYPIDTVLPQLTPAQRETFAQRLYVVKTGQPVAVTGMAAAPDPMGSQVARWLGETLSMNPTLPRPADWAEAVGTEDALLQMAAGANRAAAAGALEALVKHAGGNQLETSAMMQEVGALTTVDVESIREAWDKARVEIVKRQLDEAAGSYQLVVTHREPGIDEATGEPTSAPTRVEVGVVQLSTTAEGVSIGLQELKLELADSRGLALRVPEPAALANVSNPQLQKLPLKEAQQPIDLELDKDGRWVGSGMLMSGGELEIALEPTE